MFASHEISRAKDDNEFRVIVLGDSATWGARLSADETLAGQLTALNYQLADGRRLIAYNLAHLDANAARDILILSYAQAHEPDMIVWMTTMLALTPDEVTESPIINANPVFAETALGDLYIQSNPTNLFDSMIDNSLFGERFALSAMLRMNLYGFIWAMTGIDEISGPYEHETNHPLGCTWFPD